MSISGIPDELIVEMVRLVPRAYGHLRRLAQRYNRLLRPHCDHVKLAACEMVTISNTTYSLLPNGTKHGPFVNYFTNGCKQYDGEYVDGELHGEYREYYASGAVNYSVRYRHGVIVGDVTHYDETGKQIIYTSPADRYEI
ncbi:hypothetical protein F-LCD7_0503 [Faustovirus]|nr:hypothetical protein F-LCD7_0503 [Faustovirus]